MRFIKFHKINQKSILEAVAGQSLRGAGAVTANEN
jgi:hypothetical protein